MLFLYDIEHYILAIIPNLSEEIIIGHHWNEQTIRTSNIEKVGDNTEVAIMGEQPFHAASTF